MANIDDDILKKDMQEELKQAELSGLVDLKDGTTTVNGLNMQCRELNSIVKSLSQDPDREIHLQNIYGQRYLGTGLKGNVELHIHGTPGNDLAAFMDGATIHVHGNAQDGVGNTMNSGKVVVHGHAGDIAAYSMRGGKIFIRDNAGYRVGIHMKEGNGQRPILVIGGTAQDFLGEYMAGGVLVVLGLTISDGEDHKAKFVGTGMHGGTIYIRGGIAQIEKDVNLMDLDENDKRLLKSIIDEFCAHFMLDPSIVPTEEFKKLVPSSLRPYGAIYAQKRINP